jgi:hypothetical protein
MPFRPAMKVRGMEIGAMMVSTLVISFIRFDTLDR